MLGKEHVDTINSLINVGNVYQRMQNYGNKASLAYDEVVRVYKRKLEHWHHDIMIDNNTDENDNASLSNYVDNGVTLYRALAGTLRNAGTCYWKQRKVPEAIDRLNEAVDTEEKIVTLLLSSSTTSSGGRGGDGRGGDRVGQAKESMAQLLGLLGCIYPENKADDDELLDSVDKAEEVFQKAIQLYHELGYDSSHPNVVWAHHNLNAIKQRRVIPPPPPPSAPLTPSPVITSTPTPSDNKHLDGIVDFDDIDSVELDQALATDEENTDTDEDDIFLGVDVNNSTDELDAYLSAVPASKEKGNFTSEVNEVMESEERVVFEEEKNTNKPLSSEHRNLSLSQLSDQGGNDQEEVDEGETSMEERLSFLLLQAESDEGDTIEVAHVNVDLAEHYWSKGDRAAATDHYTAAHSIFAELDELKQVAIVLKRLGDLNQEDGALDAAKELYMEALEMEKELYGQYLPKTLNAAGQVCLQQEDFRNAMEFHRRALQIQKKGGEAGCDKYDLYETLVRIGDVYYSERNNFTNIRSKGVDYQEFIESGFLGWIANAHDMRGEYVKAIHFYEESYTLQKSKKGKDLKREMALTLNRLGSLTRELGRYYEAMDYHQKALNIQKSGSGVAKASTAETCVLMGMVKSSMGEFKSALNLYEDSLVVLKSSLGDGHLSCTKTLAQIAAVHVELSHYDQAMSILLKVERCQLATVGEKNRDLLETRAAIGRVLSVTGKYEEAFEKLKSVAERQSELFGLQHPAVADTLSMIGDCFLEQGMTTEARQEYIECYNMRKHFFTVDMIHIADSMVNIIRARSGQPERALAIYKNAFEVYNEYLADDHLSIGRLHVYEGDSHAEMLEFPSAIERYEKAQKIFQKVFGGESTLDSAKVAVNIGKVLLRKCDYESAKAEFASALAIYQDILSAEHEKITSTLVLLDRVQKEKLLCV